jgi:hypothetical protein
MEPYLPPVLHPLLQEYTEWTKQELAGKVTAFYLEGSIALREFNPRLSDIDFITVLNSEATFPDFEKILRIHRGIDQKYPWQMSGMYFQARDLGCVEHTNQRFLHYHEGKLKESQHFDLSAVTWWILKNHGIAVFGPTPQSLDIVVDMDHLIHLQQKNLNTYWAGWTKRPGRVPVLFTDWGVQWTVLGVLRQFYTIHEHQITSKIKAGEYALPRLPKRWHPIIREAIALRENTRRPYIHSWLKRTLDTFQIINYVIDSCNQFLR